MTPEERAEKILLMCQLPVDASAYHDPRNGLPSHLRDNIIAQIREAVEEAVAREVSIQREDAYPLLRRLAKAEAYQDAAKIAFDDYEWHMKHNRYCCAKTAQ